MDLSQTLARGKERNSLLCSHSPTILHRVGAFFFVELIVQEIDSFESVLGGGKQNRFFLCFGSENISLS